MLHGEVVETPDRPKPFKVVVREAEIVVWETPVDSRGEAHRLLPRLLEDLGDEAAHPASGNRHA